MNHVYALAPMADYTDSSFCRVCREVAGNDFVIFREMVSAEAIVRGNEKTLKMCEFDNVEKPIVIQLFGCDPKVIRIAAEIVADRFTPEGIDINMGCPVPKVASKTGSGAALMKDHDKAVSIIRELKKADLGLPISVKTRLGWSNDKEILEFAPKLEQAGADFITIHGRTKKQGYAGQANWERIGEVKKLLTIPVIANGDINNSEDIKKCLEITGADGVMIGRGALGNPFIFEKGERGKGKEVVDIKKVVLRHAELHLEHYGAEHGLATFRKHLVWYFKGVPGVKMLRTELMKVATMEELKTVLQKIPG